MHRSFQAGDIVYYDTKKDELFKLEELVFPDDKVGKIWKVSKDGVVLPSSGFHEHRITFVRHEGMMKCACPCGATDLANEPSSGMWTLADVVCEYRTCSKCKSTRPYMKQPFVDGEVILLFHDPLATEPVTETVIVTMPDDYGEKAKSWTNLLDAIVEPPIADVAELRRGVDVLARAFCAIDGVIGWKVLAPGEP